MVRERLRSIDALGARGFSLAELIIVMVVVGILATIGMPAFFSYWNTATLRGGAQELVGLLSSGRQVAIKESATGCVKADTA